MTTRRGSKQSMPVCLQVMYVQAMRGTMRDARRAMRDARSLQNGNLSNQ